MDDRQLENLYRANFQRVYNYAYYSLLNSAEAEDVTSAVFVKVVANIDKYDASRASFGTWITRIAHNVLVDYHRTRKPTVSLEKVVVDEPAVEDDYPVLDDRQQRVAKLLACLSEQDRELIYLKYYQEKKNVEIAQLLDMNPSTVATRLRRALIAMRACAEYSRANGKNCSGRPLSTRHRRRRGSTHTSRQYGPARGSLPWRRSLPWWPCSSGASPPRWLRP